MKELFEIDDDYTTTQVKVDRGFISIWTFEGSGSEMQATINLTPKKAIELGEHLIKLAKNLQNENSRNSTHNPSIELDEIS